VTQTADLALTKCVAAAERAAFDELFDRYAGRIQALAHRHAAGPESARVLTERMLERVFGDLKEYRGEVPLDSWVLSRCKRVLAEARADWEPGSAALTGGVRSRDHQTIVVEGADGPSLPRSPRPPRRGSATR
jgi:hypothetical protein